MNAAARTTPDVRHDLRILGTPLCAYDRADSWTVPVVAAELNLGGYGLEGLALRPGAVVIDVGAHVGIVSSYLGLRFPAARLFAFEPCARNFANLQRTLAANRVRNVTALARAVSADGRALSVVDVPENSGGSRCIRPAPAGAAPMQSVALTHWLGQQRIEHIDFLKIDCEGFEYEVLTDALLERVSRLAGEFHETAGADAGALLQRCSTRLGARNVHVSLNTSWP